MNKRVREPRAEGWETNETLRAPAFCYQARREIAGNLEISGAKEKSSKTYTRLKVRSRLDHLARQGSIGVCVSCFVYFRVATIYLGSSRAVGK